MLVMCISSFGLLYTVHVLMPHTVVLHHDDVCVCTYICARTCTPASTQALHLQLNALPLAYTHVPHTMCVDVSLQYVRVHCGSLDKWCSPTSALVLSTSKYIHHLQFA